ncbi:hypothetical protein [Xanthocytophaga flava]|uniref:hypothetical protein n=1 Tax=Xanthocytophaga flava TaxID=3048013 RepID=UPI0028D7BF9F|nr:hypothetical protein [Xanthocytophaga flavus]MDJ1473155.1 hypothetical protein [Xanthocytophaga flavus]
MFDKSNHSRGECGRTHRFAPTISDSHKSCLGLIRNGYFINLAGRLGMWAGVNPAPTSGRHHPNRSEGNRPYRIRLIQTWFVGIRTHVGAGLAPALFPNSNVWVNGIM